MPYCAYCGTPVGAVSYAPCPKCGNPSNGAPPPVTAPAGGTKTGGGTNTAIIVIAIVIGVFVLIAVVGIVAAIAIPNFITAKQRAMQKRTMADIRSIAAAAEAYATDNNEYPRSTDVLSPKYIKTVPRVDGWSHPIDYECIADETGKCTGYRIGSRGKDGRYESGDLHDSAPQAPRQTTNFDCDIIYSNGSFVEYPEGVQR